MSQTRSRAVQYCRVCTTAHLLLFRFDVYRVRNQLAQVSADDVIICLMMSNPETSDRFVPVTQGFSSLCLSNIIEIFLINKCSSSYYYAQVISQLNSDRRCSNRLSIQCTAGLRRSPQKKTHFLYLFQSVRLHHIKSYSNKSRKTAAVKSNVQFCCNPKQCIFWKDASSVLNQRTLFNTSQVFTRFSSIFVFFLSLHCLFYCQNLLL